MKWDGSVAASESLNFNWSRPNDVLDIAEVVNSKTGSYRCPIVWVLKDCSSIWCYGALLCFASTVVSEKVSTLLENGVVRKFYYSETHGHIISGTVSLDVASNINTIPSNWSTGQIGQRDRPTENFSSHDFSSPLQLNAYHKASCPSTYSFSDTLPVLSNGKLKKKESF